MSVAQRAAYKLDEAVTILLPLQGKSSSRRGKRVRLIVFHTAEGARTVQSLASWFRRLSVKASSHVGIDDDHVSRMVPERDSAWTAGPANPSATQAELCGFASWSADEWREHPGMIEGAARWAAAVSEYHDIPLDVLPRSEVRTGSGVCDHYDITRGWPTGSHTDCGPGFREVLVEDILPRARHIRAAGTHAGAGSLPTTPTQEEDHLMAVTPQQWDALVAEVKATRQDVRTTGSSTRKDVRAVHAALDRVVRAVDSRVAIGLRDLPRRILTTGLGKDPLKPTQGVTLAQAVLGTRRDSSQARAYAVSASTLSASVSTALASLAERGKLEEYVDPDELAKALVDEVLARLDVDLNADSAVAATGVAPVASVPPLTVAAELPATAQLPGGDDEDAEVAR